MNETPSAWWFVICTGNGQNMWSSLDKTSDHLSPEYNEMDTAGDGKYCGGFEHPDEWWGTQDRPSPLVIVVVVVVVFVFVVVLFRIVITTIIIIIIIVITCHNFQFWQVCSSDALSVCLSVCLFVCLFGLTLLAGYRSHRLTNHHQTWPKCLSWTSLETYLLYRSKVK